MPGRASLVPSRKGVRGPFLSASPHSIQFKTEKFNCSQSKSVNLLNEVKSCSISNLKSAQLKQYRPDHWKSSEPGITKLLQSWKDLRAKMDSATTWALAILKSDGVQAGILCVPYQNHWRSHTHPASPQQLMVLLMCLSLVSSGGVFRKLTNWEIISRFTQHRVFEQSL